MGSSGQPSARVLLALGGARLGHTDDFDCTRSTVCRIGIPAPKRQPYCTRRPQAVVSARLTTAVWIIRLFSLLLGAGTVTMTYLWPRLV